MSFMCSPPLFSILIAQYNNGKFLMEAIDSVKAQTYTNWEIIIVDDCSTDNSKEIYTLLEGDPRINIYFNKENKGCGYTKHRCAELATGELCGFLDPDDTITPDALEVMVREHGNRDNVSMVCSRYKLFDDKTGVWWLSEIRDKNEDLSYLTDRQHSAEAFTSYKNSMYLKTEGINPTILRAVDMDMYFKLEERGKILFIDDVLYNYRLHDNGISQTHFKAKYWLIQVITDACARRGLKAEDVCNTVFTRDYNNQHNQYLKIKESKYYKLGYLIIHPFERVVKKIRKIIINIYYDVRN